jgi:hypothetical protein
MRSPESGSAAGLKFHYFGRNFLRRHGLKRVTGFRDLPSNGGRPQSY